MQMNWAVAEQAAARRAGERVETVLLEGELSERELIQVADELDGFDRDRVMRRTAAIGPMLRAIFRVARERSITTLEAAEWMVRRRLAGVAALRTVYRPQGGGPANPRAGGA